MIALIDKAKKKSFLIHLDKNENGGILNDFDGGTEFQPQNYFTENGHEFIVGIINPYQIRARVTSSEFKNANSKYMKKKLEFEKLASSLKETDNPVMMLVRLKK